MPRAETVLWATAWTLLALFAATVALHAVDRRLLDGAGVWAKPLKFELALALHCATLALVVGRLSPAWRDGSALAWIAAAAALFTAFEVAYIALQASRQLPSHFYLATPLYGLMYGLMAAGAVVITLAAAAVGVAAWLDPGARLGPATRLAVLLGLGLGSLLTLVVAFRMGGALDHHVGLEPPGAPRLPLVGWSLAVGDRRVPHFFATHMMQALPLGGLLLDRLLAAGTLGRAGALAGVAMLAAGWTTLTLVLFHQANAGLPLHRWPFGGA